MMPTTRPSHQTSLSDREMIAPMIWKAPIRTSSRPRMLASSQNASWGETKQ
jgi:hypothetical protein